MMERTFDFWIGVFGGIVLTLTFLFSYLILPKWFGRNDDGKNS